MNNTHTLAQGLADTFRPTCLRLEVAGSIRRGKSEPKDIELVAIPKTETITNFDLFGEATGTQTLSLLDGQIASLIEHGEWEFDPEVKRNGEKYKRLRHCSIRNHADQLVACDLFICQPRTWGIIYTLRTGPSDFSKALVTRARGMGWHVHEGLLHQHSIEQKRAPKTGQLIDVPCPKGSLCPLVIPTLTEEDFFNALGLSFIAPAARAPNALYTSRQR